VQALSQQFDAVPVDDANRNVRPRDRGGPRRSAGFVCQVSGAWRCVLQDAHAVSLPPRGDGSSGRRPCGRSERDSLSTTSARGVSTPPGLTGCATRSRQSRCSVLGPNGATENSQGWSRGFASGTPGILPVFSEAPTGRPNSPYGRPFRAPINRMMQRSRGDPRFASVTPGYSRWPLWGRRKETAAGLGPRSKVSVPSSRGPPGLTVSDGEWGRKPPDAASVAWLHQGTSVPRSPGR